AGTPRPADGGHAAEDSPTGRTADDGAALADRIVSALLTWTLLGTAVLTVAVIVLAEPLAQLLLATQASGEPGGALGPTLPTIFRCTGSPWCWPRTCRRAGASSGPR